MLADEIDTSKGMSMRRLHVRAAAVFACALATTGCAMIGGSDEASKLTGPEAAKTAAETQSDTPYGALINKQPTSLDGEIRSAQLMRAQGDFDGAVRSLSQLMLVAPDDPRVVGEYGKVLAQQGRTADALAFLSRAIELQPDNWTFYSALGVSYDQMDQRAKAETAYQHALSLKPNEPTVLNNYAVSQMLAGNLDRAEDLLHQAAAHDGDYPKIANNLAMVSQMRGHRDSASGPESAIKPAPTKAVAKAALPAAKSARPAKPPMAMAGGPRKLQPAIAAETAPPHVVMQSVPHDPLAGKVYGKHGAAPSQLAQAEVKPEAKPAADEHKAVSPALRTAADLY